MAAFLLFISASTDHLTAQYTRRGDTSAQLAPSRFLSKFLNCRGLGLRKGTISWNLPLGVNSGGASSACTVTSSTPLSRNTCFIEAMTF